MSLIKCNECGQMVSDKASNCPQCGAPIDHPIKCEECGQMIPHLSKTCPHCGNPIGESRNQSVGLKGSSSSSIKIVRIGNKPLLGDITLEIQSNGNTIGIYPFKVGFDMDIPVSSDMVLFVKLQGTSTPIRLSLNTSESYICKITYSFTGFSYELYNKNGVLLKKEKLGIGIGLLCFFIPIVGIIYYFVKRNESPAKAKGALIISLIGIIISILQMIFL